MISYDPSNATHVQRTHRRVVGIILAVLTLRDTVFYQTTASQHLLMLFTLSGGAQHFRTLNISDIPRADMLNQASKQVTQHVQHGKSRQIYFISQ